MRWTVDGAIPSRGASYTGPSRSLIRKLTQRLTIFGAVWFGLW